VGDGVVVGSVEVLRPVVHLLGSRLYRAHVRAVVAFNHRHAQGRQHAHRLVHRQFTRAIGHDQVHHVVRVRQAPAIPAVDRNQAVNAPGLDALSRLGDAGRVGVQPVDKVAVVRAQRDREFPGLQ
jgi:hypothetical protein